MQIKVTKAKSGVMEHKAPQLTMYETCLLHSRADRALRAVVAQDLEQHKVTLMEWLLLGVVSEAPSTGISMSNIASSLDITMPQVTALVSGVTKKRLVNVKTQKNDRRSRHASVSQKGLDLLTKIEDSVSETMEEWTKPIPPGKLQNYVDTVRMLAGA